MKNRVRNKILSAVLAVLMILSSVMIPKQNVSAAPNVDYPAQLVRIATSDGSRNINITDYAPGSLLNVWVTNGAQNENWRFDYVSSGVFKLVNQGTGLLLSPENGAVSNGTKCVIAQDVSQAYQQWKITAVSKDSLGNDLHYKITNNANSSLALTYNQGDGTITISNYTGASNQHFLLNTAGLVGFAGYGKDINGKVKASAIGGLLGETVFVSSYAELNAAAESVGPKTIVITSDIYYDGSTKKDSQGRTRVSDRPYVKNDKTIIGSYDAHLLYNVYFSSYYEGEGNNLIFRNITARHGEAFNCDNLWEFSNGTNIWIDHINFEGHSTVNTAEVGGDIDKFIALKGLEGGVRKVDYVSITDCTFGKHEYGNIIGYPQDTDSAYSLYRGNPCVTMANNYFNGCITRAPGLFRYGYFHTLNNYVYNFSLGYTIHTGATLYSEGNYYDGGGDKGSVVNDNALNITEITNATTAKVGPWYTDSGSIAVNCYKSNNVKNVSSLSTSWRPNGYYQYSAMPASQVASYCRSNAGAKSSRTAMNYYTFAETGVPSAHYVYGLSDGQLIDGGTYMIKNLNSGLYLEVQNANASNGANVQQWSAEAPGAGHNTWIIRSVGHGEYKIYSALNGGNTFLLDVTDAGTANGTNIQIWEDTNHDAQTFKIQANADGTFAILTKVTGNASGLDVDGRSTSNGANVLQWPYSSGANQKWYFEPVEGTEKEIPELLADFTFDTNGSYFDGGNAVASGTYSLVDHDNGKALSLNGSGQFLSVTAKDSSSLLTGVKELTVAFEINPGSSNTNWAFFAAPNANEQTYMSEKYLGIFDKSGTISAERYNSSDIERPVQPSAAVGSNKWYDVAVTYTGADTVLYIDGVEVARQNSTVNISSLLGRYSVLYIGKATWGSGEYATALIDNYKIYSRALTAQEIEALAKGIVQADKTELESAIKDAVAGTEKDKYTEASWEAYEKALKTAEVVFADENATQEAVDTAVAELLAAKGALVEKPEPLPQLPYVDVPEGDWFYEAVYYNYLQKTMTGVDPTHFDPFASLSRSQFATILYRIEGEPKVTTEKSFLDISGEEWYGQAVLWAAEAKIVTGYENGYFGPADPITREQMAVMMYRFANYLGQDTTSNSDYNSFLDAASVSPFAKDAMKWVVEKGIITGKAQGTMLDPQGNTLRAEAAMIIQRFMTLDVK